MQSQESKEDYQSYITITATSVRVKYEEETRHEMKRRGMKRREVDSVGILEAEERGDFRHRRMDG